MSDAKRSSQELSGDETASESSPRGGFKLGGGRFRAPLSSSVELPVVPDDDEAVGSIARRFRAASSFKSAVLQTEGPSLDQAPVPSGPPVSAGSSGELESFLLDVLDSSEPSVPYVIEEVAAGASTHDGLADLPLVDVEPLSSVSDAEDASELTCPSCQASNPPGMRFCVQCGGGISIASTAPRPAARKAAIVNRAPVTPRSPAEPTHIEIISREPPPPTKAARLENPWAIRLISINEDGTDGAAIALEFLETTVGRDGDTRFPTDAFLSPKHARFHIEKGDLFIEDLYSLNGTFLKLRDETRLTAGDTILMGRQVLRFERFEQSITPRTKSSDGTRYMGSPAPGGQFKVLQVGIGGVIQNVYCLPESGAVLGREKGDIIFPHDKFMSSRHAQIYSGDDGHSYLVDLNSSNGTWIKLCEKTRLEHKDYIFMGQQLFRVHYDTKKR